MLREGFDGGGGNIDLSLRKTPLENLHQMQTNKIAWVDPSNKLQTQVNLVGA